MALIGYVRVSTHEQNADLQRNALKKAGCRKIYEDIGQSGSNRKRPGLMQAMEDLKRGDTLVVWKIDRAFRSLMHALTTLEALEERGITLMSLTDHIETVTAMGRSMYQICNVFAELERSLISERTRAGLAAAKARGQKLGRPRKDICPKKLQAAQTKLAAKGRLTQRALAQELGVSIVTLRKRLEQCA